MDEAKILELARKVGINTWGTCASSKYSDWIELDELVAFARLVAAAERESCARLASDMVLYTGLDVADAIRLRTE